MMEHDNVRKKKMCMCNWVTMLYSRKSTEQCKPAIVEKIKIVIKKSDNNNLKNHLKSEIHRIYEPCILCYFIKLHYIEDKPGNNVNSEYMYTYPSSMNN